VSHVSHVNALQAVRCSVCGAPAPFGLGPPANALLASGEVEARCRTHVWPEVLARARGLATAPPERAARAPLETAPQQPTLFSVTPPSRRARR
jgi:hypothetical protein